MSQDQLPPIQAATKELGYPRTQQAQPLQTQATSTRNEAVASGQPVSAAQRSDATTNFQPVTAPDDSKEAQDEADLEKLLEQLNQNLYSYNKSLRFEVNRETGDTIIEIVNTRTGEKVRQIPAEEVIERRTQLMNGDMGNLITQAE